MYERRLDAYVEAEFVWEDNNKKIYNLLLSHCTESMHTKLQSMSNRKDISKNQDGLKLMVLIRNVLHQKDKTEQNTLESVHADKALYLCYQKPDQTNAQYLHAFKAKAEVCRLAGGSPGTSSRSRRS